MRPESEKQAGGEDSSVPKHKRMRKLEKKAYEESMRWAMLRNASVFASFHPFLNHERRFQREGQRVLKVQNEIETQRLIMHICCPTCNERTRADRCKRWSTQSFPNLKCIGCGEIASTREWRCTCGFLWYKCPIHHMPSRSRTRGQAHEHNTKVQRRKVLVMRFGTNKPLPRHRDPRGTPAREEAFQVYRPDGPDHNLVSHYSGMADLRAHPGDIEANCLRHPSTVSREVARTRHFELIKDPLWASFL